MHASRHLRSAALFALLGLLLSACVPAQTSTDGSDGGDGDSDATATSSTEVPRTTGVPTMRPTPAEDLGIVLDDGGRPYDHERGADGFETETRPLTRLRVDRGRLEVVDGDALNLPLLVTIKDTESVDFGSATDLDLRIVWQQRPVPEPVDEDDGRGEVDDGPRFHPIGDDPGRDWEESILGVRISAPGATVTRWGRFELAYDSDAGIGAVTSRSVLGWADANLDFGEPLLVEEFGDDRPYLLIDRDDQPGIDLFLFDNGAGSGPRVLTEGFDEDDRLVAIMLWDRRYPWRLAVPDGSPPPDVIEREQELIDCIEGRRLIDKWGRCT